MKPVLTFVGCLLSAFGLSGCVLPLEGSPEAELELAREEQALSLQIASAAPPQPPKTEIPSCWWVDDPDDCDDKPECVPQAPTGDGRPTRLSNLTLRTAPVRTSSTATTASLSLKAKDACPSPDGVPTCSTCKRSMTNPLRADLELSLASRVLVTNGLNSSSYVVKNYPILNAQAYADEDTIPRVQVDLSLGATTMQSGVVDLSQDLYMFFTSDFDTGPYPIGNWVFCPKNGNPCVQLTE